MSGGRVWLLAEIERAKARSAELPWSPEGYEPTRWWRVVRDGTLWMETSDEEEAREAVQDGDVLERLWEKRVSRWRPA